MYRGSPNPQLAHSHQRGNTIPSRHWRDTSIQELRWNWMSCPEALPNKKKGEMTAVAVRATNSSVMRVELCASGEVKYGADASSTP